MLSLSQGRRSSPKFYRTAEEGTEEAKLIGSIPKWLSGTYLRTGPGFWDFPDGFKLNHWLDGYAIISKFHVNPESVKFEKKFLKTDSFERAKKANRPCVCEFGTRAFSDPNKGWMSRLYSTIVPEFTDNANISAFSIGNNVFVSGETCYFHDLSVSTISAGQRHDTNKVFGIHSASPHPITDPESGITYNIGSSYAPCLKYSFVAIPPTEHTKDSKKILKGAKVFSTIPSRWNRNIMSYNHSFGLTKNYLVFIEQPYVVNLNKILSSVIIKGQSFKDWAEWCPEYRNRFYVIDKKSGKVVNGAEFMSQEPFFFIHMINCYEDQGQVVVNVSVYDSPEVLETQNLALLREGGDDVDDTKAFGVQYVIPIDVDMNKMEDDVNLVKVESNASAFKQGNQIILTHQDLTPKGMEFPVINKKYLGRKNRFYYASGLTSTGEFMNAVVKVDMVERTTLCWRGTCDQVLGEPVFVNNPDLEYLEEEEEDEGVLICPMTDYRDEGKDMILFLDPKTMKELARSEFNEQIPPSIHGLFVPS